MDTSDIIDFYMMTQGEIDKLWEYFILSHLAMIGWLITVEAEKIDRAKIICSVTYIVLFSSLFFFFYDGYSDMKLIQKDLLESISSANTLISNEGFINKILSVDIEKRLHRVLVFFIFAGIGMIFVLIGPILAYRKNLKNVCFKEP